MKLRKHIICSSCGSMVYNKAGLFRCNCGWTPRTFNYISSKLSMSEKDQQFYDHETLSKPIDGRPIPLDLRYKHFS